MRIKNYYAVNLTHKNGEVPDRLGPDADEAGTTFLSASTPPSASFTETGSRYGRSDEAGFPFLSKAETDSRSSLAPPRTPKR